MKFSVLTYNIHKAIGVDRRFDPDRIVEIIEHHDTDIVLLQEVDRDVPRSNCHDLASLLAKSLNYEHRAVGMNVVMKKGRYGNATLSRFPIGRQHNIDLTLSWRKRRGAQHTRVLLPLDDRFAPLDVFNVHLGLSARERQTQVSRLLGSTDMEHLSAENPCIVAGDMNDWRNLLKRRCFAPCGFNCATNRLGSIWSIKTFPSFAPAGGLDKIFYRGGLELVHAHRSRLALAQVASDHLPVIAEFEMT